MKKVKTYTPSLPLENDPEENHPNSPKPFRKRANNLDGKKYILNQKMKKILFVCSQNRLRSPTAEAIFYEDDTLEVRSAGLNNDAEIRIGIDDIIWADYIFVMEQAHKRRLCKRFGRYLKDQSVICLGIRDEYNYMDEELVKLLGSVDIWSDNKLIRLLMEI